MVVNPDNYDVLKTINPMESSAANRDFCDDGCDYTAYVTFSDGSLRKAIFPGSHRNNYLDVDFESLVLDGT